MKDLLAMSASQVLDNNVGVETKILRRYAAALEIGKLIDRVVALAPEAGLHVDVTIKPAKKP